MVSLAFAVASSPRCFKPDQNEYCRIRELPRLLRLWPSDFEDYSYPGTLKVIASLRNALRAERRRARASHWAYDLNRHMGLIAALRAERERLSTLGRCLPPAGKAIRPVLSPRPEGTLHLPCWEKKRRG
jgi:hypothetical protein